MEELGTLPVALPHDDSIDTTEERVDDLDFFVLDRKDPEQRKLAALIGWGRVKELADQDAVMKKLVERNIRYGA